MKNVVIIFIIMFALGCEEEEKPSLQQKEVIEEINFYALSQGADGLFCDSLSLNEETTFVIFKWRCDETPIYKGLFNNKEVESFIDTLDVPNTTILLEDDFNSIRNFIDLNKFFELEDSVALKNQLYLTSWEIEVITNKRTKRIYVYLDWGVEYKEQNIYVDDLLGRLNNFKNYHILRIANILGGWK